MGAEVAIEGLGHSRLMPPVVSIGSCPLRSESARIAACRKIMRWAKAAICIAATGNCSARSVWDSRAATNAK